jgi:hypothetical protein
VPTDAHAEPPTFMAAAKAGDAIRARVDPRSPLTVADAAAQTGLALRDAESGLKWLSTEYHGQLRVTGDGQLVHVFPQGFTKPWEGRDARKRAMQTFGRGLMGVLRFIVRAWVAIVLVGYAAIFVALILAMTFARQGNDSRRSDNLPGGALAYAFFRVLGDALFWTFHPWSPFGVYATAGGWDGGYQARRYERRSPAGPRLPLYERVNRFFFGPAVAPEDPRETERKVLAAIRAGKGRIGLADVMRATGLPREKADPMMARLMLDYEGDVGVSEDGGIFYSFAAMRKTASEGESARASAPPPAAWDSEPKPLQPLTGNSAGANLAIAALNAFNLLMGFWVIGNGLTLERVSHLFDRVPPPFVDSGVPIALGVIPIVFSSLLFVVPLGRALFRPLKLRKQTEERGRLAVLRAVLERVRGKQPVTDGVVADAWRGATGRPVDRKRLDRELVALGGDVDIEGGGGAQTRWRFPDLETEAAAVAAEREAAADEEARLGDIAYATDER